MDIRQYEMMQKKQAEAKYAEEERLCDAKRMSAADEVMRHSEDLANVAEMLVNTIAEKLGPYMQSFPQDMVKENPVRTLPPYFDNLRDNLNRIANAINAAGNLIHNSDL